MTDTHKFIIKQFVLSQIDLIAKMYPTATHLKYPSTWGIVPRENFGDNIYFIELQTKEPVKETEDRNTTIYQQPILCSDTIPVTGIVTYQCV